MHPPGRSLFRFLRRTLQLRLALLYTCVFFVSSLALLAIPYFLLSQAGSTVPAGTRTTPGRALAMSQQGADVRQLLIGSVLALAAVVPLSSALGWLAAGRLLRPLRTMTATAREISATNLHRRLALDRGDDELRQLGETLDDLFARLEASFVSQRRFVANASHELRTPLAGQRTLLQVALADPDASTEMLRSTCEEALTLGAQQEHLIEALLMLATTERGVERWEGVDLAVAAGRVLSLRRDEVRRRGLHVVATLDRAALRGDPRLVESLVANLVDNALRHNVPGGRVDVATRTVVEEASITVRNTGPLIAVDELPRLFHPFERLGGERTGHAHGHGLGLAIVHAIGNAHGAALVARARPAGGLEIEVRFPTGARKDDRKVVASVVSAK